MVFDKLLRQARCMIEDSLRTVTPKEKVEFGVEPAQKNHGDISSNVAFLLSKKFHQSPADIADTIVKACRIDHDSPENLIKDIRAHPTGYINIYADWDRLSGIILTAATKRGYADTAAKGISCVVEHTSVNPNKALHIGHVRNVIVGDTISRILKKAGYKVKVLNYVDDSGLQVADVVLGFTHLNYDINPPSGMKFDAYCGDIVYVNVNKKYKTHPELRDIRNKILYNMEQGDTDDARMAETITRRILAAQLQTCWNLGVKYDLLNFESHIVHSGLWQSVFEKLKDAGITKLETEGANVGCWVIHDKVLVRSNGTATYMAKDIPYAAWKLGLLDDPFRYVIYKGQSTDTPLYQTTLKHGDSMSFGADMVITVIDSRQSNLQNMISEILHTMGDGQYIHLGYEAVTLSRKTAMDMGVYTEGKAQMSGRQGIYVGADTVYQTLHDKAYGETSKRNPNLDAETLNEISQALAVGTLRYEMIRQDLGRPITFDMAKSTRLDGDTAPYILYSYARACRILEKAPPFDVSGNTSNINHQKERDLLRLLGMYPLIIRDASANLSPKVVARYCHGLAVAFNAFYESQVVIGSGSTENARLCLTKAFSAVIRDALATLGIDAPSRM